MAVEVDLARKKFDELRVKANLKKLKKCKNENADENVDENDD